jgi:glycerol-3-phosphate acyltransferase PlsX
MITIAVDCMGGDHGLSVTLPACEAFLQSHPDAALLLVGQPDAIRAQTSLLSNPRCTLIGAAEVVAMDDPVEVALRRKKTRRCASQLFR